MDTKTAWLCVHASVRHAAKVSETDLRAQVKTAIVMSFLRHRQHVISQHAKHAFNVAVPSTNKAKAIVSGCMRPLPPPSADSSLLPPGPKPPEPPAPPPTPPGPPTSPGPLDSAETLDPPVPVGPPEQHWWTVGWSSIYRRGLQLTNNDFCQLAKLPAQNACKKAESCTPTPYCRGA